MASLAASDSEGAQLKLFDNYVEITFPGTEKVLKLYFVWLRDHCRCSQCYNSETNQTLSDLLNISLDIKPLKCEIITGNLKIAWNDEHVTVFSLSWLQDLHFPNLDSPEVVLWDGSSIDTFKDTTISATDFFKDASGPKHLLKSLKKYGFGFVTDVEPTLAATEFVAKQVADIKRTIFGEMWVLDLNLPHKDTAYSEQALTLHTDNTYFSDTSGLLVFHILDTDGLGGETILADGFNVAHILEKQHPLHYKLLCNTAFECRYIENEHHFHNIDPVIKLHHITKQPLQIRYNTGDRAPFTLNPPQDLLAFYEAYQNFTKIVSNPQNEVRFKLRPGSVLFFDNWRLLHGRTAFTGKRELVGCYISRDEWLSKARSLGINII